MTLVDSSAVPTPKAHELQALSRCLPGLVQDRERRVFIDEYFSDVNWNHVLIGMSAGTPPQPIVHWDAGDGDPQQLTTTGATISEATDKAIAAARSPERAPAE